MNAGQQAKLVSGKDLRPLLEIGAGAPDASQNVLGNRFLCRGGAMLFIGPSGIGKSSASVQQDILWSLGRPAFAIRPARPLRILTVQAENDDDDLGEMHKGVCEGLRLSSQDLASVRRSVFYETECGRTQREFLNYLESRLRLSAFDIVRIDPLLAYLGADVNDAKQTAEFLRTGLNPLLLKYRVAGIVNHHTPKVTNRDTSGWREYDWMYAGAGSADITNWARAALVIDSTHTEGMFKFIAAKRGGRIGWFDEDGERERIRYFCHAKNGLYWRDASLEDLAAVELAMAAKRNGRAVKTPADLKALVPMDNPIPKVQLIEKARINGFTRDGAVAALSELIDSGELHVWRVKRPRTNAEVRIFRREQTLLDAQPQGLSEDSPDSPNGPESLGVEDQGGDSPRPLIHGAGGVCAS